MFFTFALIRKQFGNWNSSSGCGVCGVKVKSMTSEMEELMSWFSTFDKELDRHRRFCPLVQSVEDTRNGLQVLLAFPNE